MNDRSSTLRRDLGLLVLTAATVGLWSLSGGAHEPRALPAAAASDEEIPARAQPMPAQTPRLVAREEQPPSIGATVPERSEPYVDATDTMGDLGAAGSGPSFEEQGPVPAADTDQVAAAWRDQAPDESWSTRVQEYLRTSLEDLDARGTLVDVSCRETLCRATFEFADDTEANRYADSAGEPSVQTWIRALPTDRALGLEVFFGKN